ncbi:unnamed protein product [Zymoseptoria tritici ST99CH_1E4]|uniref:Histidine kinase n=1 Tax=Zymoseptoria tritici ST99CH_1E4 TaxID=1276532 RepID=A0A2H1GXJ0_ZYMTR|nr:unnamed protein product [Zymoseptoria tritici ST99CH_1E4]
MDDESAEMEEKRKLPIELTGLVDFLDWEEAPNAIVRVGGTVGTQDVVYLNPALTQLVEREQEVTDLTEAIRRSWTTQEERWAFHGKELEGKRWRTRMTGEYCVATAIGQRKQSTERPASNGTAIVNGHETSEKNDTSQSLDWTRHPMTSPSAWIESIRTMDWSSTAIGPMSSWCPTLRQYMLHIMSNPEPRLLIWGESMTFIYNEACVEFFGEKHPHVQGKSVQEAWSEIWEPISPMIKAAYAGQTVKLAASLQFIERHGYTEETYWDFAMVPIVGPDGRGIGLIDEITETTSMITADRRRRFLNELSEKMQTAATLPAVWTAVLECIESASPDLPFAMLYTVADDLGDDADGTTSDYAASVESQQPSRLKKCVLAGTVGVSDDNAEAVKTFTLHDAEHPSSIAGRCYEACKGGKAIHLSSSEGTLPESLRGPIPGRSFDDGIRTAIVCPLGSAMSSDIVGVLVLGLNPRSPFNSEYKNFLHVAVEMIEKAAALISLPEEQRRAQKLADDITTALTQQLRLSNIQAEKNEAKFSRMADSAPIGMFMFGPDGKTIYTNKAYKDLLGVDNGEETAITSQKQFNSWGDLLHADDLDLFLTAWARVTDEKVPITFEYRLKRPWSSIDKSTGQNTSGETWLHATAFPEIAPDGSVTTVQGWLTDISHRKFSENLLSQKLEDALENKRQTENFIDMTSHEMRNPLSAILQSADSILSTLSATGMPILNEDLVLPAEIAEEIIDAAQVIVLCAQHQKRIVDDILTLSKLDASLLVISPDKVQVPALIKKALKMYEAEIERADIDAQLQIEPTYEDLKVDWVVLDPSRLLQVVINLLTNSIKFTQYSSTRKIKICIGASRQRPSGQHHGISFVPPRFNRPCKTPAAEWGHGEDIYLQVAVYDTGRGLNDDEMKVLFGRFQQASPKTYQQYGGSGLGLFISRELCELQCGQIGVSSKDGQTVFTFYVRAKRWLNDDHLTQAPANAFASASASPIAYSRRGSIVMNPPEDQMEASAPLPDGSTVTTFKPLSRQPSYTKTPLQLVTEQTPDQVDAATMTSPTATPTSASTKPPQLHVLIVEDNTINARVMSKQLRRAGCIVHIANHGGECLDFLDRSSFCAPTPPSTPTSPNVPPTPLSIILLDLEMPTMDGLTCIRHIRERQANGRLVGHVPVIAVTANARSEQIHFAIEAGMDQVVTKPFRIPELVPRMEGLVGEILAGLKMNGG